MIFNRRRSAPRDDGPVGMEVLLLRADRARDAGDAEAAATFYAAVHERAPDRQDIKVQLGNMLKDSGRLKEALAIYQNAQAVAPHDADICVQVARAYKLLGDRERALAEFRRAATLDPYSGPATEELANAGVPWQQERRFEADLRAGGPEALRQVSADLAALRGALDVVAGQADGDAEVEAVSGAGAAGTLPATLAAMRATLDALATRLPHLRDRAAIPLGAYPTFRDLHPIPPPPDGARVPLTVILLADREAEGTLASMLDALAAQTEDDWRLLVVTGDPARRALAEQHPVMAGRHAAIVSAPEASEALAEWRAAQSVSEGWLVLLAPGALLAPTALAWMAAAPAHGASLAYVADEDRAYVRRGAVLREAPSIRQLPDYDTLLDANTLGETIAISAEVFARLSPDAPAGSVARARGRLLLDLAREGSLGHVPYPLVSRLDATRASLPEHRLAVADHAAAHGFGEAIRIAKGAKGATDWRPAKADVPIAVLVPAVSSAHDLRELVRTLRGTALSPDHLSLVIVTPEAPAPDMAALLDELGGRRHITLLPAGPGEMWASAANRCLQATQAPIVVVAHGAVLMQSERWDDRLRGLLARQDIGAVGVRLLYGDDTLAHAGILLGWRGGAVADGAHEAASAPGPARRFEVTRAVGALSGAFVATRRERLATHGGFDAAMPEQGAVIDYGLALRRQGLRLLWTPAITLRQLTVKVAAAPDEAAEAALDARWGAALAVDPGLNPTWHHATLPFRLLADPTPAEVVAYIRRTARADPWTVTPRG